MKENQPPEPDVSLQDWVWPPKEPVESPKPRETPPKVVRKKGPIVEAQTDRLVAKASDANRPFIEAGVTYRRGKGLRSVSTNLWARAICRLDRIMKGTPFTQMGARELAWALAQMRKEALGPSGKGLGPRSMNGIAKHIKAAWRDLLNTDVLPRDINRALTVHVPPLEEPEGRLVSDDEFHGLLRAATMHTKSRDSLPACVVYTALLWTLWDSGFRADEMLSLNVGDVTFYPDGLAKLRLRPEAPELGHGELKTGPRTVNVGECVPALKALLALHPNSADRDAPLFPNPLRKSKTDRLRYLNLSRILTRLANQSRLNEKRGTENNLTAHDFRHTCATRKARLGWKESALRAHFGWGASSRMPAHYVHLSEMDLLERVRRDLGITPEGFPLGGAVADPAQTLAHVLTKLMRESQAPSGRTKPSPDHALA